ncbi:MAG: 50S ribosomal protein L23 [Chlorobi bacterium]|nr:50S ribosomal protein L23 [Chlorobiota bacterium]
MSIIKRPILTEKMVDQTDKYNRYGFIVDIKATKEDIKREVEKLYNVEVLKVRTMIYPARKKTKYTRKGVFTSKEGAYKKALVDLKEGQSIDFYNQ